MKVFILIILFLSAISCSNGETESIAKNNIKKDLDNIISGISQNYIYLSEKSVDLKCIRAHYESQVENIDTKEDVILLFENLLNEFYDSHLILNTNVSSSYRLYAPIYVSNINGKFIVSNVWQSQIEDFEMEIIGAEITEVNGVAIHTAINEFVTQCSNKESPLVREWIANKIIAGRYNEPRILSLALNDSKTVEIDLDEFQLKESEALLTSRLIDNTGVIRINNSLGNNYLISEFDKALDDFMDTEALIIDLRNTVDGGNTYVARGLMGRFVSELRPYQKHWTKEMYGNNPAVERSWVEYVSPRGEKYKNPVYILVGRWTGSMGEGIAIGFDGIERGEIVGTHMQRLAGEMSSFSFDHLTVNYRLSTAKLFHIDGTPREEYIPKNYVMQTTLTKDETLNRALYLVSQLSD